MKYQIKANSRSRIAHNLAMLCQQGNPGESLILQGFSQELFTRLVAEVSTLFLNNQPDPKSEEAISGLTTFLMGISAANASAARQQLENCKLVFEDGTEKEVKAHWGLGPTSPAMPTGDAFLRQLGLKRE